mmetsp:Transcript_69932/g.161777  ORF Transcript_69932/g.161777 Transcript_69932/m.161777 type:complete len:94 (+) Transcript_69932:3-284(+)
MRGHDWAARQRRCLRDQAYHREDDFYIFPRSEAEVDCLPWHLIPELGGNSPVVREAPASPARYWLSLWARHLAGRATFLPRSPAQWMPMWREL